MMLIFLRIDSEPRQLLRGGATIKEEGDFCFQGGREARGRLTGALGRNETTGRRRCQPRLQHLFPELQGQPSVWRPAPAALQAEGQSLNFSDLLLSQIV